MSEEKQMFTFVKTKIDDCVTVKGELWDDQRGALEVEYMEDGFRQIGLNTNWPQSNITWSRKNVIRGLYYSADPDAVRYLRTITGIIYAVCVDIRFVSKTYGQVVGRILSGDNRHGLFVPGGCAYGFGCLDDAIVHTRYSTMYSKNQEGGLRWNDPKFDIAWPIDLPILSVNDMGFPYWQGEQKG